VFGAADTENAEKKKLLRRTDAPTREIARPGNPLTLGLLGVCVGGVLVRLSD